MHRSWLRDNSSKDRIFDTNIDNDITENSTQTTADIDEFEETKQSTPNATAKIQNEKDVYISNPKYKSLKEELLHNKIYTMTIDDFNSYLLSAYELLKCKMAKRIKAAERGLDNKIHLIPVDLALSIAHLFVLTLYTNLTDLQYNFKKFGTRKVSQTDTLSDIKQRHTEITNWFRLLYEAVLFFGNDTTPNDQFYHGLNVKLLFGQFSPHFKSPISTTTNIVIAQRFAKNGIVISLKANTSREDRYFSVAWLSAYPSEKEKLFVEACNVDIVDIRMTENLTHSNTDVIRAIKLFDEIFKGYYFIFGLKGSSAATQKDLSKFIDLYNGAYRYMHKKYAQSWRDVLEMELSETYQVSHTHFDVFSTFVFENEYDSDALLYDSESVLSSNIINYLKDENVFDLAFKKALKQFVLAQTMAVNTPYLFSLFCNLVQIKMSSSTAQLYVIKSDFAKLERELQHKLISEQKCPLFRTNNLKVCFIEEFVWEISGFKMRRVKLLKTGNFITGDRCKYRLSGHGRIEFVPDFTRSETKWPNKTGFGILIKAMPRNLSCRAFLSLQFEEIKFYVNDKTKILKNKMYMGYKTFDNCLLEGVESLTIRIAIKFDALS